MAKDRLWNTLVLAGTVETFVDLGRQALPAVSDRLACIEAFAGTADEAFAVHQAYALAPEGNFSRAVLEPCPRRLAVSRLPAGVTWSDWGTPARVLERQAAEGNYQELLIRRALGPLAVRDVMTRDVVHVPPDLPVTRVADEWFWRHHVSSFPVVEDGRLLGILSIGQLGAVPRERWAETRARDLMRPLEEALTIEPTARLTVALQKLTQNGLGRLAVLEGGTLVGYLSLKDALHVLAVATAGGGARPTAAPQPPRRQRVG